MYTFEVNIYISDCNNILGALIVRNCLCQITAIYEITRFDVILIRLMKLIELR